MFFYHWYNPDVSCKIFIHDLKSVAVTKKKLGPHKNLTIQNIR